MNIYVKLKTYESMDYDDVDVPAELSGLANCSASVISNKAESSKVWRVHLAESSESVQRTQSNSDVLADTPIDS